MLHHIAQTEKAAFYERFDLQATGEAFRKGGKKYIITERSWNGAA